MLPRRFRIVNTADRPAGQSPGDTDIGPDTGPDIVGPTAGDLGDDVRVGDMGAGHADHVGVAVGEDALGVVGVDDAPDREHRQADHLLDGRRQGHEQAVGRRGRRPVGGALHPVEIGAGDNVEIVELTAGLERLGDLGHGALVEAVVDKLVAGNAHADDEVGPGGVAHRRDHLEGEAQAVFQGAAVAVAALVSVRRQEVGDQQAEGAEDLNAVETARTHPPGGGAEGRHHLVDFRRGHGVGRLADQFRGHRRGRPQGLARLAAVDAGAVVGELGEHAAAFLAHRLGKFLVTGNNAVVDVGEGVGRAQVAGPVNRRRPGDLQGDPAPRLGPVIGDIAIAGDAVVGDARHMGGDQHPVAQGLGPDLEGRQQMGEFGRAHNRGSLRVFPAAGNVLDRYLAS